ncbi:hypothetical protein ACSMFR_05465 [Listeria aquatica]|uniref:hypothetical protein n=1 Tax=Listeria aquatica TaxID=1494960 RepID=UPI003F6EA2F7
MKFKDCTSQVPREHLKQIQKNMPHSKINYFVYNTYSIMRSEATYNGQPIIHMSISESANKAIPDAITQLAIKELASGLTKNDFEIWSPPMSNLLHLHYEKRV